MISLKTLFSLLFLLACIATSVVAKKKEDEEQALRDVQLGLQGLKEATQNPALLAQMMRDLQVRIGHSSTHSRLSMGYVLKFITVY